MAQLPVTGIDVSEFNGDVNIAALKGQISFVIIRCGYGSDYSNQDDSQYEANVRKCEAAGIPYGVYLYSYAKNTAMAESEAAHTLRLLKGKRPLYGVWYDVEDSSLPTGETLIDNCITYCRAIENAGYYCGIYASLSWWNGRLNSPRLDPFDKWVAEWNDTLDYNKPFGIWQYTDNGILNGRRFDMNRAYKDYPKIIEEMEGTDMTKAEVAALARQEAQKVYQENEERYKTLASVPGWARSEVEQVYEELDLNGTGEAADGSTQLNASATYVRALYVIAKVLDKIDGRLTEGSAADISEDAEQPVMQVEAAAEEESAAIEAEPEAEPPEEPEE